TTTYTLSLHDALPIFRRIQVQPDHIPELALKLRVVGDLEGAPQVRLQVVVFPDAMHTLVRHSHRRRHAPGAPFLLPFRRLHHTRSEEHTSELQSLAYL